MKSGIYKIKNIITGDCYIGSAKNYLERWQRHRKDLRGNKHHSIYLQRAFTKYGESSFIYGIIEYCELNELEEKENSAIQLYKPCYNICPTAYSQIGRKLSDEHIDKLKTYGKSNNDAKILLKKYAIEAQKKITMLCYHTLKPQIIFPSLTDACIYLNKTNKFCSTLSSVCIGKRKSAFGYKWKFTTDEDYNLIEKENNENITR